MEIERCPFCGGEASIYNDYTGMWLVQCDDCGISTLHVKTVAEAIAVWNRRPLPQPPREG